MIFSLYTFHIYFKFLFRFLINREIHRQRLATNRCTLCSRFTDENESRTTVRRVSRVRFRGMLLPRFRQSGTAGNVVSSCTKFATAISRSIFEDYPISVVALLFRSRDLAQWGAAFSRFPFRTEDLKFRRRGLTEIVSSNFVHDVDSSLYVSELERSLM